MYKSKIFKTIVLMLIVFFLVMLGYDVWYRYPANVIKRISGFSVPLFVDVAYESAEENWQDSHVTYVLKISDDYSKKLIVRCESIGGKNGGMNYQDLNSKIVEAMKVILSGGGNRSSCQLKGESGAESWELVIEGRALFFNYYFYDRP